MSNSFLTNALVFNPLNVNLRKFDKAPGSNVKARRHSKGLLNYDYVGTKNNAQIFREELAEVKFRDNVKRRSRPSSIIEITDDEEADLSDLTTKEVVKGEVNLDVDEGVTLQGQALTVHDINKRRIAAICTHVVAVPTRGDDIDVFLRFVNGMVLIRLENPFETLIKRRIQTTMNRTVTPILQRLDVLERKAAAYEKKMMKKAPADSTNIAEEFQLLRNDLLQEVECTQKGVVSADPLNIRVHMPDTPTFKDTCIIIPDRTLDKDYRDGKIKVTRVPEKKQMLMRVTSWVCRPVLIPNTLEYHVDLTKKSIDVLVEEQSPDLIMNGD